MNTTQNKIHVKTITGTDIECILGGKPQDWRDNHEMIHALAEKLGIANIRFLLPQHGTEVVNFQDTTPKPIAADGMVLEKGQSVGIKPAGCPTVIMRTASSDKIIVGHCSRINMLDTPVRHIIHSMLQKIFTDAEPLHVSIVLSAKPSDMIFSPENPKYGAKNQTIWDRLLQLGIREHPHWHLDLPQVIKMLILESTNNLPGVCVHHDNDDDLCFPDGDWWLHPEKGRNLVIVRNT